MPANTTRHNIYGVPDDLWLQASIEALRRGIRVGDVITRCLEYFLDDEDILEEILDKNEKEQKS